MDLLFVIDNSGSMSQEQQNLIANFPMFISVLDDTIMNVTLPSLVRQLGAQVLTAAGIDAEGPGVLTGTSAKKLVAAIKQHTGWARADLVTASAVAPAR